MELRDKGVYKLAGWQELVAAKGLDGMYCLFTPEHWRAGGALDYLVLPSGRLVYHGAVTSWSVGELADTGRTAAPPDLGAAGRGVSDRRPHPAPALSGGRG